MIIDDNDSDDDDNLSKHPVGSIAHVRRDRELGPLAFRHLGHTLVPAGNHLDHDHYDDDDDDDDGDDDNDDDGVIDDDDDDIFSSSIIFHPNVSGRRRGG